jgi:hypothetical protein
MLKIVNRASDESLGKHALKYKNYLLRQKKTRFMNETREKYEDILQYEIDALKEIRRNWFERAEEHTRHVDLVRGVALGLALGIVGNLFVHFLYPLIEALLLGEYKPAFVGNFIVCTISLILIVFVSMNFRRQLAQEENKLKSSRKSLEVIEYAITRRQHSLQQKKKNNNLVHDDGKAREKNQCVNRPCTAFFRKFILDGLCELFS